MHDERAEIEASGAYGDLQALRRGAVAGADRRGPLPGDPAQRHGLRLEPAHALRPGGQHVREGRAAPRAAEAPRRRLDVAAAGRREGHRRCDDRRLRGARRAGARRDLQRPPFQLPDPRAGDAGGRIRAAARAAGGPGGGARARPHEGLQVLEHQARAAARVHPCPLGDGGRGRHAGADRRRRPHACSPTRATTTSAGWSSCTRSARACSGSARCFERQPGPDHRGPRAARVRPERAAGGAGRGPGRRARGARRHRRRGGGGRDGRAFAHARRQLRRLPQRGRVRARRGPVVRGQRPRGQAARARRVPRPAPSWSTSAPTTCSTGRARSPTTRTTGPARAASTRSPSWPASMPPLRTRRGRWSFARLVCTACTEANRRAATSSRGCSRRAREQGSLRMVADQRLTPTFTADLARAVVEALDADADGVLHLTNSGECSWHEFTRRDHGRRRDRRPGRGRGDRHRAGAGPATAQRRAAVRQGRRARRCRRCGPGTRRWATT